MKQLNKTVDNSIDSIIVNFQLSKQYYNKTDCVKLFNAVKPGGHVLLFSKTDIQYMTGINARLAGFDIRDTIYLPSQNVNIIVARKPLSESTVAANTLKWGTGGLNIDASRIEGKPRTTHSDGTNRFNGQTSNSRNDYSPQIKLGASGRFPANIILDESMAKVLDEQSGERPSKGKAVYKNDYTVYGKGLLETSKGQEIGYGDTGGASRFFFKASTDKQLLTYLETLITPVEGKCIKIG